MQAIIRSKVVAVALVLLLFFVPLAAIMDNAVLYVVVGSVLFTTSLAVLHAYWPALKIAVSYSSTHSLKLVDLLTMGIVLIFMATALREMYVTFYRVLYVHGPGREDEYFVALSFFRYAAAIAAVLFLQVQNVRSGERFIDKVPGWPHAIISVVAGLIFAVALISAKVYIA